MKLSNRFFSFLLVMTMIFTTMVATVIPSSAARDQHVSAKVGDSKLLVLNVSEPVQSSAWYSTNPNVVMITSTDYLSCRVEILEYSDKPVTVHCEYNYMYYSGSFGYLMSGYQDFIIEISGSSSGGNNGNNNNNNGGGNDSEEVIVFTGNYTLPDKIDISETALPDNIDDPRLVKIELNKNFISNHYLCHVDVSSNADGSFNFGVSGNIFWILLMSENVGIYDFYIDLIFIDAPTLEEAKTARTKDFSVTMEFYCTHKKSNLTLEKLPSGSSNGTASFKNCPSCNKSGSTEIDSLSPKFLSAVSAANSLSSGAVAKIVAKYIKIFADNTLREYLKNQNSPYSITVLEGEYVEGMGSCNLKVEIKGPHNESSTITYTMDLTIPVNDGVIIQGDATGDGKINLKDVSAMMKYVTHWCSLLDTSTADVTGDGKVNLADVSLILKYLAKWDVTFK